MAPEKAPAFQFYPKDWDTDVNVIPMTYEEEGVYWALCRMVWLHGSVPADLDELRLLLKGRPSMRQMQTWWRRIGKCFEVRDGMLYHRRLDKERKAQADSRERRADAAKKRWEKEHSSSNADAMHMQASTAKQCTTSASASASPSASATPSPSPTPVIGRVTPTAPLISGQASPRGWDRRHGSHMTGFCDWVCLDEGQVAEFAAKIPGDDDALKRDQIRQWALDIRRQWADRIIPDGSSFDFWRNRWTETHGGSRPANATLKAVRSSADLDEAFR